MGIAGMDLDEIGRRRSGARTLWTRIRRDLTGTVPAEASGLRSGERIQARIQQKQVGADLVAEDMEEAHKPGSRRACERGQRNTS